MADAVDETPRYGLTARLFLQALAAIYFFAFISLIPQLPGLVGPQGLLPATDYLAALKAQLGLAAYWHAPTLAWFGAHAGGLQFMAAVGALASLLAIGGILTVPCFVVMWAMYLSLAVVGQDFMSFQWDRLLLAAGCLAIFLTPLRWTAKYAARLEASPLVVRLYRFLLAVTLFSSGAAKLVSGDRAWRSLTAVQFQLETQPLPTPLAWAAHHLPAWLLKFASFGALGIELIVPFLLFLPRRARMSGAVLVVLLQLATIATGNYSFLNWLTLALCLPLIDDALIEKVFPRLKSGSEAAPAKPDSRFRRWSLTFAAALAIAFGLTRLSAAFVRPPRLVTSAVQRQEIIIEGSDDGVIWKEYAFHGKPGDVKHAPRFSAPFQPRLDWQMSLAAADGAGQGLWFTDLMLRLLQGSPSVTALFEENPFPQAPPAYVRATLYVYRFTDPAERKADGAWWRRQMKVEYFPTVSLRSFTGGTQ